ncbi:MAG: PDZ domain-containing protein [Candidatus Jacksonbacteria bacterium]|jgi:serine protease Do|nr:PDZ domain-containing protein [Candidatus Jacksonbacteria bacterium]MBT6034761.1 PDZ domain-containing protein [Candidatus Jacksonbacteria bacterium]MBT6301199.1 PDZ domain-containing protein [Candidatus Jacksonbacteria bacterium]MBT6757054.1 PDZ domain-containing protein [Candidatus Jacksonbacteria bacterium]MBT6954802.1 PDZ domain-containing protein [Candidatus Jacksonbacteria bacterium]
MSLTEKQNNFVRSVIAGAVAGFLVSFVMTTYSNPSSPPPPDNSKNGSTLSVEEESQTVDAVEKVLPSVVSIVVTKELAIIQRNPFSFDPFNFFGGDPFAQQRGTVQKEKRQIGGGSGFIVTEDGLIVTNRHVVIDEDAEYSVVLNDGTTHEAEVLDRDLLLDLAVLKIDAQDLPVVELGDSESVKIGQTVIAIGNALGEFQNSVTKGVVSGLGRNIVAGDKAGSSERLDAVIQTDAAISPGNSGGPLINLAGQVIGVNTAVSQEGENIGFAIPVNEATRMVDSVKENGRIVRPYLGVRYILLNEAIAEKNEIAIDYGALIVRGESREDLAIIPGSPADKAGLLENDIILEVDGSEINEENSLARALSKYNVDDVVTLKVVSKGKEKDVLVTLIERSQE